MSQEKLITQFDSILEQVETLKLEHNKFVQGNKASGARARKAALEIKKLTHAYRATVSEIKTTLKK